MELLKVIRERQQFIVRATAAVALLVLVVGGLYFFLQPARTVATQMFRPTFVGADSGHYPNAIAFGPSDVIDGAIIDQVFDKNRIQDYCARDAFRSGFVVAQVSPALLSLDADYQGRLSEPRITAVERDRLLQEYKDKRSALPLQYQLAFLLHPDCRGMSNLMLSKILADVLSTWAEDAEVRRGVLNLNVQVLTANSFDIGASGQDSLLIRADLLRGALQRLADNMEKVSLLPGASLIRFGEKRMTFLELRDTADGLLRSKLEPLVVAAGQGLGRDSLAWAAESLATAIRDQKALDDQANAFLVALREYSGTPPPAAGSRVDSRQNAPTAGEIQAMPQIDREFVDRILELSTPNVLFRQELTRKMLQSSVAAASQQANVSHYQRLVDQLRQPGSSGLTPKDVADRLQAITAEAKALAKEFNDLYEEFSRVSLRSGASMYSTTGPARISVDRAFTLRDYLVAVAGAFASVLLLTVIGLFGSSRLRQMSGAKS